MIYNFGSLNIDYVYQVQHFVRSGETISSRTMTTFPGGKGLNQSVALARAGAAVRHCGFVSRDSRFLTDMLAENGVDVSLTEAVPQTNGHAIIQVDVSGQNCILLYGGTNLLPDERYVARLCRLLHKGDVVLFQNETSAISEMMRGARAAGAFLVMNPSPMDVKCLSLPLSLVNLFILNETEGQVLTGETEAGAILAGMQKRYPDVEVVLTLGKQGAWYAGGHDLFFEPAIDVGPVVDTTAAGDTFTGFFLAARTAGRSAREAIRIAARAAGISVTRKGAAPSIPTWQEVSGE